VAADRVAGIATLQPQSPATKDEVKMRPLLRLALAMPG